MDGKMTKRKRQAIETRNRILRCALELFEEKGYDNVSIQEIAERSQASVGSIYHYFKSKEEITVRVTELLDSAYRDFYEGLAERREDGSLKEIDKLKLFYIYVQKTNSQYENIKNLYIYSLKNPDRNILSMTDSRELYRIYQELIAGCRREGTIGEAVSNEEVMDLLLQSSRGMIVDWLIRDKDFDLERQAERWFELICHAALG